MKSLAYQTVKPLISLSKPYAKAHLLRTFKAMSPRISETERQVLEIGDVGIEGEIYKGTIDWKGLFARDKHELSAEEQAFLDGPVEELCRMIDNYALYNSEEQDVPEEVWNFIKENKFLGLEIPKEYGGLGFSALAHSRIIEKISSRSFSAAINVMVPNSLGPAALILHYGTEAQKERWLRKLASGELLPCFALTEENAGSDATNIESRGEIRMGEDGKPYIEVTRLSKRYSTLAPIADLPGIALDIHDPDNLLGQGTHPGTTVVLVEKDTPGMVKGNRHKPAGVPFQNGTIKLGEGGMKLSIEDNVVGGIDGVGKGWPMLVELLSVGRGISLTSVSTAAMKMSTRIASAYGRVRKQFGMPVGEFKGVKKVIGEMAGLTYISEATKISTLRTIDSGKIPSVATAIVKYHLTEHMRECVINGMDILGGKAVMQGRQNLLADLYQALPIGITVEGANIMTRNFMIFGQGSVRAHPYILDEIAAAENENKTEAANQLWNLLMNQHIPNILENADKAKRMGRNAPEQSIDGYKQQIERLSAAFNLAANTSVITIGGALKKEETLGARMGDVMSYLYMAVAALEKFEADGRPQADQPLVDWSCQWALEKAEEALAEFIPNYRDYLQGVARKQPMMGRIDLARFLEKNVLPKGRMLGKPTDKLTFEAAEIVMTPNADRDRLTDNVFLPDETEADSPVMAVEKAFGHVVETDPLERMIRKAVKSGELASPDLDGAVSAGIINAADAERIRTSRKLTADVVRVDEFPPAGPNMS